MEIFDVQRRLKVKNRRILLTIIIKAIILYFALSLIPVEINNSYAADKATGTLSPDINEIDESLYPGYKDLNKRPVIPVKKEK